MLTINRPSFKLKIIALVFCVTIIGIVSTLSISFFNSKRALMSMASNQLSSLRGISQKRADDFFKRTKMFTTLLGTDRLTEGLILAYESAFYASGFSVGNDYALDKKAFSNLQAIYQTKVLEQLKSFQISNYYLTNMNGQFIFSAIEDTSGKIAGRHAFNGLLKGTKLSKCVDLALKSKEVQVFYADYEFLKTIDRAAAYFCVRTHAEFPHLSEGISKGDVMGVVVVEFNFEKISELLSARDGMGETGQTYIVGEDGFLRSDMYLDKDTYNVNANYRNATPLNLELIELVKKGEKNNLVETKSIKGEKVLAAYSSLEAEGNRWIVISEKNMQEILSPVYSFLKTVSFIGGVILIVLGSLGLYFAVQMSKPIIESVEKLNIIAEELRTDSEELNLTSMELSESASGQEKALQNTISVLDEITATIAQNSDNARNSARVSLSSLETADIGRGVVHNMIQSMDEINVSNQDMIKEVQENNQKIQDILNVISEIESKTKVINDIVFQTKLLSFNASVESARAGEHGKGFAVVAEEIGNLANMSGKSAQEISELLSQSVQKVSSTVNDSKVLLERISREGKIKVEAGQTVARECGNVFNKIYDNFTQVNQLVTEISTASNEQSQGMAAINEAMTKLSEGTTKSTNSAIKSSESAGKLDTRSSLLRGTLSDINKVLLGNGQNGNSESPDA